MNPVEREQHDAREALLAAVGEAREAESKIRAAIRRCRNAQLSIKEIAELAVISRPTVYERLKETDPQ